MISRVVFFILIIALVSTGCDALSEGRSAATPTEFLITATLPATSTSAPSQTALPPLPQPTNAPIEGTTSTQINVRTDPSTVSSVLGMVPANTRVEILGKDPGGNWFQINYQQGANGKGWVTAKYVTIAKGTEVPVVGTGQSNPNNRNVAIVQQQINVRSGPGTGFNSVGILNAQDVLNLIGKDSSGSWLQIEFASGPDGKGWVNAAFVQAIGVEHLPIIAQAGNVIGTGTPTVMPPTTTPTVLPAWADHDSQNNPAANVEFEPLGIHALIYSGDVSAPQGDSEDWIQFTPYNNIVVASLGCSNNNLEVHAFENGQPIPFALACGDELKQFPVKAGYVYLIKLQAPHSMEALQYIRYTIHLEMGQK